MTVYDLNREQLTELKREYLFRLADAGCYNEIVYGIEADNGDGFPPAEDLILADEIVPDDVIYSNYADTIFCADDFE